MNKRELDAFVEIAMTETKNAIQAIYDELNHGQQKKIVKNELVKKLFDLYGVNYSE